MTTLLSAGDGVQLLWPTQIWSGPLSFSEHEDFSPSASTTDILTPALKHVGVSAGENISLASERLELDSQSHIPMRASRADWSAWIWTGAHGVPTTEESGCVHLHDPRAGANLTVLPGLPWGRPAILHPAPGTIVIWPGWLTWTLLPISEGHHVEAVYLQIDTDPSHGRAIRESA